MPIAFPDLPYAVDALEPHLSHDTMLAHYGKHHRAYVVETNRLIAGSTMEGLPLEEIVRRSAGDAGQIALFNNAAQAWNHDFFWHGMKPGGGSEPHGDLAVRIKETYGGLDGFKTAFTDTATRHFGSGWAWLIEDDGTLRILSTANAETPITTAAQPLLACDLWEHAYYLDYQNRRPRYVAVFLANLVDWDVVSKRLARASRAHDAA